MPAFRYYCPIQVRYGDLDPQWHVNNARTVTFLEQARFSYLIQLGLFDGVSFFDVGVIVADVHVTYLAPIRLTHKLRVGVRVARIGNKSFIFEYQVEDENSATILATAETVMVAYNYHTQNSIPVPPDWREKITAFEGLSA